MRNVSSDRFSSLPWLWYWNFIVGDSDDDESLENSMISGEFKMVLELKNLGCHSKYVVKKK